ncbi:MAG: aminotransferase class I/II-fold pyridoxal phosphate-dependent enzyme [Gemmatimonadetes bacterium]|nr:aminotransferase class I/II-fold pyridoxal phosphate-dependent enzyme [Gemmatimonadota bacterium]
MRQDYLTFGSPQIGEEEIAEVVDTLRSGWIGTGPKVAAFEEAFRNYVGAEHAIAVSSCTAALHLSVQIAGMGPGDEIITTPMTFCATANAIVHAGVTPIFADINRETMNLDPTAVEAAITPATKAIIPVHFAGRPCDMEALCAIAKRHNLLIIEDAAHAIESRTATAKIGAIGDLTCFSFYVTKNVVTAEGGMITTDRSDWVDRLKSCALHGMNRDAWKRYSDTGFKHYQVESPGFKYNMTDIQASLGIHQLRRVEDNLRRREEIWQRYDEAFADWPLQTPARPAQGQVHGRHLYTIMVDQADVGIERDAFQLRLHELNIGTGIHYVAVHLQPYYARTWGFRRGDFPEAEYVSDRTLSLPLGVGMSDGDVDDVIATVKHVLGESGVSSSGPISRAGTATPVPVAEAESEFITVVSGLPRSGTSMLMKMLAAGGLPPLTDGIREADEDNPGGYYELEQVKNLGTEEQWIEEAGGKAVKVISQLLETLPSNRRYKVVFALRDMHEILASQRAMLKRRGQAADEASDAEVATAFNAHLREVRKWLAVQSHIDAFYVDYAAILRDALAESRKIAAFLALPLDTHGMAGVVNEDLYRQRA